MTTQQVAKRLTELCRKGEFETAQKELFSKDAISIEPQGGNGFEKETKGLNGILEKGHKFEGMMEKTHGINVSEPIIANNSIAFKLDMDVTMKGRERENMAELCVYEVKDGKIVKEEFFW